MQTINFATGNPEKIQIAKTVCEGSGISVKAVDLDIHEIQSEYPELIVRDKARRAFEELGEPVVVSDDTWDIHALHGFPGAYMKSINHWFSPEDFLRLMEGVEDRRVTLHQFVAFTDGEVTKIFKNDLEGTIIKEIRGSNDRSPNTTVTVLDSDNGKTIAEVFEQGPDAVAERYESRPDAWHEFLNWYTKDR